MELSTLEIKISSVEIAERTGKEHSKVKRDIEAQLGQIVDVAKFGGIYKDSYGREQDCYYLPKRETLILVSGYSVELRSKIIDRLEELEKQKPQFQIPQTLSEALLLAGTLAKQIEEQTLQLELQQPKVAFYEAVTGSSDTIDIGEAAKVLNIKGIGRNNLFQLLREKGVLDSKNKPYQNYCDRGYFRVIESSYCKPDGSTHINLKTVVYQKGLDYIRKLLEAEK